MYTSPRDRRRASTRGEILEAAWEVVRAEGLAALSMRDLGSRVGLSAAALYRYFPSKLDIYDALFADGHEQLQAHLAPGADAPDDPEGAFRRSAHRLMAFCVADPVRYTLLFQRMIPGFEPSPASMVLARRSCEQLVHELAALGVRDRASIDLWAAVHLGLTGQQVANDPGGDRWVRLVDDAVDMYLAHVRAHEGRGEGRDQRPAGPTAARRGRTAGARARR